MGSCARSDERKKGNSVAAFGLNLIVIANTWAGERCVDAWTHHQIHCKPGGIGVGQTPIGLSSELEVLAAECRPVDNLP
jgi:hypothetical protein